LTSPSPSFLLTDRYEKRHKNLAVHISPCFRVELGDQVTVGEQDSAYEDRFDRMLTPHSGQCRPLSKTVRFNVIRVSKSKASAKTFGKF